MSQAQPFDCYRPSTRASDETNEHSDVAADDAILSHATAFARQHPAPGTLHPPRLSKPIAIPQLAPGGAGTPFARCFPTVLRATHAIEPAAFLEFLDNLNIVAAGTAPLRVLGAAGGLLGMVPWHYATLLSLGVQAAAKAGNRVYASVRGDKFLAAANADFFAPRGLRADVVTTEAMWERLQIGRAHV